MLNNDWLTILKAEIAATSQAKTAKKLGYSETAISLILNGKYRGKTDKFAATVIAILAKVNCPYTGLEIDIITCHETAYSKAPSHNHVKMKQWRACQNCPHKGGGHA